MPKPIVRPFAPAARKHMTIIQAGVKQGLSSRAINRAIALTTVTGKGIRRRSLTDAISSIKGKANLDRQYKFMRKGFKPDPNEMWPTETVRGQKYFQVIKITGTGVGMVGTDFERLVTVASQDVKGLGEALEEAKEYIKADINRHYDDWEGDLETDYELTTERVFKSKVE